MAAAHLLALFVLHLSKKNVGGFLEEGSQLSRDIIIHILQPLADRMYKLELDAILFKAEADRLQIENQVLRARQDCGFAEDQPQTPKQKQTPNISLFSV